MKKVLNISLAGRSFAIEEDAYKRLSEYLGHFRTRLAASATGENAEVMEDLESRISELFMQELGDESRVVSLSLVERVTGQLGMPDGAPERPASAAGTYSAASDEPQVRKKIYRDYDNKRIAGVCAGLAIYLDIDVVLTRVLMLVALIAGTAGFWVYVICWIAIPKAVTPTVDLLVEKYRMTGAKRG